MTAYNYENRNSTSYTYSAENTTEYTFALKPQNPTTSGNYYGFGCFTRDSESGQYDPTYTYANKN
jgi:hypothetical protein